MNKLSSTILAIETSCDDTAISIVRASDRGFEVLASEISSQIELHAKWGGVVPNLAARAHQQNIFPLLSHTLQKAKILPQDIDLIAVTEGPGLIPALLVGTSVAKTLSYLWEKPLLGIHHVEGHIYANFIGRIANLELGIENEIQDSNDTKSYKLPASTRGDDNSSTRGGKASEANLEFPALCLVVSGGHTQLVLMKDHLQYEIIGQTLDDAAGEAFDKVARILGIGYPGGPMVAQRAENFKLQIKNSKSISNDKNIPNIGYDIKFPRPLLNRNNFDFSFSGLKTAVLYETKKHPGLLQDENYVAEVCHEFQQAVVDVLVKKTIKAALKYEPKTIMLAGGVSANKELRKQLGEVIENNLPQTTYNLPQLTLTGDNAAMIAAAAFFRWKKMSAAEKEAAKDNWKTLTPDANLKLE